MGLLSNITIHASRFIQWAQYGLRCPCVHAPTMALRPTALPVGRSSTDTTGPGPKTGENVDRGRIL